MPTVKIALLALSGLVMLPPVIATRWAPTDTDAPPAAEIRQDNQIATEPARSEYFPAQYQNQSQTTSPEPHIQAF